MTAALTPFELKALAFLPSDGSWSGAPPAGVKRSVYRFWLRHPALIEATIVAGNLGTGAPIWQYRLKPAGIAAKAALATEKNR